MTLPNGTRGPLGLVHVPQDQAHADGSWGTLALYGPEPRPEGFVDPPRDDEMASALVTTEWICPRCLAENDVWGEGAVDSWMECSNCLVMSFLVLDPGGTLLTKPCPGCGHALHPSEECEVVVGYDHLNGDHECGCQEGS